MIDRGQLHQGRKVARAATLGERWIVPDPKNITETTTLADLREQLTLLEVVSLRLYPPIDSEDPRAAAVHHAIGIYIGTGPTEAGAIEAAFVKLRHALLPGSLK